MSDQNPTMAEQNLQMLGQICWTYLSYYFQLCKTLIINETTWFSGFQFISTSPSRRAQLIVISVNDAAIFHANVSFYFLCSHV